MRQPPPAKSAAHGSAWFEPCMRLIGNLSCVTELPAVAERLSAVMASFPWVRVCGLIILDDETETARVFPAGGQHAPRGPAAYELPLDAACLSGLDRSEGKPVGPVTCARVCPLHGDFQRAAATCELFVPLRPRGRCCGFLFAGTDDENLPESERQAFAVLADLLAPVVWNCLIEERFSRGDRRRDVLVELSKVINTSLQGDRIHAEARIVLAKLEPHCRIAIALARPGAEGPEAESMDWYEYNPDGEGDGVVESRRRISAHSAAAEVLRHGRTLVSGDLRDGHRFEDDHTWTEYGVRRYVATPMFAAGRVIGVFFFGSTSPHPPRAIDVWLFENIALQLALAIDNAAKHAEVRRLSDRLAEENEYLQEEIHSLHDFNELVGESPQMKRVLADIDRVAGTDATVLITGETGVGKELVARAIHARSRRSRQPMIKVNCAAIPESMVESELFGHERGAFTSAVSRRTGRFELANNGTLLLDEIGELSPAVQAKLLRVLQDGEFERVGGSKTIASDARIIASTNRDLRSEVEAGRFRADLFYRINVFPVHVPPLRERREDIPLLVDAFVGQLGRSMGRKVERIDADGLADLKSRTWPGNVRELRHEIERAIILCDDGTLRIPSAPSTIDRSPDAPARHASSPSQAGDAPTESADVDTLEEVEARHIRRALERTGGVIAGPNGAAELLGLKPSTLRFRMKRLAIDRRQITPSGNGRPQPPTSTA